ncbi:MAG: sulfate adenylyltransferase subunit CysN [Myxococcota bacterium]
MSHRSELIASNIEAYLAEHERKDLLRFLTCGSVDDGKSTLIGRLLHDAKLLYEDQLAAAAQDSKTQGTTGDEVDLALLMDGLRAEREQGITIDVAYRYFSTGDRKFIIADTPGHEQYTRNMATGASTCDLAVILVDAQLGIREQTRRHSFIASILGIKHVVVAVNKMDLVDFSREVFDAIREEYAAFAARLGIRDPHCIPLSALRGDNVVERSAAMPWYTGPPLMEHLETVEVSADRNLSDFRFPVQIVLRPDAGFRGYAGIVASGIVQKGDDVAVLPSGKRSRVSSIVTADGDLDRAFAPMSVALTLDDEIDVSRGDMIVHPHNTPRVDHDVEAMVVWMAEEPMVPGKPYLIKHTTRTTSGTVTSLRHRVDVNTLGTESAPTLDLNEIGRCHLSLEQPLLYDPYAQNRATGSLILIDPISNGTVGAGMILGLDSAKSDQLRGRLSSVTDDERRARYGQQPVTLLLTGLAGAGKSTIAYALERRLFEAGRSTSVLDGQNMRLGISKDLGFTFEDRSENLRRSAEVARVINEAGLICICAFLAPSRRARKNARDVLGAERFLEIHLDAPVEVCRERDREGLYPLADRGEIVNFPGVSAPYQAPEAPDLRLATGEMDVETCVERILELLRERGFIR